MKKQPQMTSMIKVLAECSSQNESVVICWDNGVIVKCNIDGGISIADNGLELYDPDYFEFYMAVAKVVEIVCVPVTMAVHNSYWGNIKIGSLLGISQEDEPTSIEKEDGTVLWDRTR